VEVQHASQVESFTSGTSGVVTVDISAAGEGNTLVASVSAVGSAGTPSVTAVETGSEAENWAEGIAVDDTANTACAAVWVDSGTAGGGTSVAVTVAFGATATATDSVAVLVDVFEFSGLMEESAVDQASAGPTGQDSADWTSDETGETAQAEEIAVGVMTVTSLSGALTVTGPAAPWANQAALSATVNLDGTAYDCYSMTGYQILNVAQAVEYAGSTSQDGLWDAAVLTLKAAAPPPAAAAGWSLPLFVSI
jgi:hypothetical protein